MSAAGRRLRGVLRSHRAATVAGAVVLAVAAASGGGEYTARLLIRERVARAVPALNRGGLTVDEDGSALWDLLHRRIPRVDIESRHAGVGPLEQVDVHAQLYDVRFGDRAAVGSSRAEVSVPAASIGDAVRAKASSVPVTAVATDPGLGTITVDLGAGGVAHLTLRPLIRDGRVSFATAGLSVLGRAVDPGGLGDGLGSPGRGDYPLGMRATSVEVTPTGLLIRLRGGAVPLRSA
ncbi:LmeA family phospholipid-binding protein [Peterkaempfera sp. SMS 1(5)a]|uniref:LmeA family phospholipid-binding protein n=1 Tax=Peterkaempfera podocarpi TaxID=3232308 RepID=UPI00366CAEDC